MRWSFEIQGLRSEVKAKANADSTVPAAVKKLIGEACDDVAENSENGIRVHGHGRTFKGAFAIGRLEIEPVAIAVPERTGIRKFFGV